MYVNKEKEGRARRMVGKITSADKEVNEDAVKETYLLLGGLWREGEIINSKKKNGKSSSKSGEQKATTKKDSIKGAKKA